MMALFFMELLKKSLAAGKNDPGLNGVNKNNYNFTTLSLHIKHQLHLHQCLVPVILPSKNWSVHKK